MKVTELTQFRISSPGLKLLVSNLKNNASDILEEISISPRFVTLKSITGRTITVTVGRVIKGRVSITEIECVKTNAKIRVESITKQAYCSMTSVEQFLAIERLVYDAIHNGQNYHIDYLLADKCAALGYFKRPADQYGFGFISVDGMKVTCGTVTFEHHFKPPLRRTLYYKKYQLKTKPLTPTKLIYRLLIKHIYNGGTLTKYSYWHIIGIPKCDVRPNFIIEAMRAYVLERKWKTGGDFTIYDYSKSGLMETIAHLLDFGYVSVTRDKRLSCPMKPSAINIRTLVTNNPDDVKNTLDRNPEDLMICTSMKRVVMDAIMAHGRYSLTGIDMNGVKNYVYAKLNTPS